MGKTIAKRQLNSKNCDVFDRFKYTSIYIYYIKTNKFC